MAFIRIYLKDTLKYQTELNAERLSIGRADDNDIVIDDPGVSSRHAELIRTGSGYEIADNHSTNGVFVNGQRVQRQKLKYWDEIQIFNHVLKYMAVARLGGESDAEVDDEAHVDATVEVDVSNLDDLVRLRRQKKEVYLSLAIKGGRTQKYPVKQANFSIGRGRDCDLRVGRLFAPRVMANIQHRSDGFYLKPGRWGGVRVNGAPVRREIRLRDSDRLRLLGVDLTFCNRVPD